MNSKTQKLMNSKTQKLMNSKTQKLMNSKTQKLMNSKTQKLMNSKTQKLKNSKTQKLKISLELFENSNAFLWVGVRTEQTFHKSQQAKVHFIGVNDEELSHVFAVNAIQTGVSGYFS